MLWYKAWIETRLRFLICLIGITFLCGYNVYRAENGITSPVNDAYYHSILNGVCSQLTILWLLGMTLTTMGGLLREKAVGAASFTMALPFSRARLAWVRIAVASIEGLAMIAIPWGAIFALGGLMGRANSMQQALLHLAYLTGGGVVYIAIALLAASLVEGEYTAPVITAGVVIAMGDLLDGPRLGRYSPLGFMGGGGHYYFRVGLLGGAFPWEQFVVYVALSIVLVLVSVRAIQMREF